jgi:hypothetical protein
MMAGCSAAGRASAAGAAVLTCHALLFAVSVARNESTQ